VSTGPRYSYYSYNVPHNEAKFSIDIAASNAGTFVVAWEDLYQYVGYYSRPGIFHRRFDTLRALGREFRTTPITSYIQGSSHVASDKDGNFVVVWDESGYDYTAPSDTDGLRVMARHFNAGGGQIRPPFQVNTYTTGYQYTPKVAFDGAGNFIVVWAYYDDAAAILAGQKYGASGLPVGGEFQVNSDTSCCIGYSGFENPGIFDDIDIAGDEAGNFVVVWRGPPSAPGGYESITARFFDPTGAPRSDQFVVNSATTLLQAMPAVAADHQGNFIISWSQDYFSSIFARRYDAAGNAARPRLPGELRRLLRLHRRAEHRGRRERAIRRSVGGVQRPERHHHGPRVRQHRHAGRGPVPGRRSPTTTTSSAARWRRALQASSSWSGGSTAPTTPTSGAPSGGASGRSRRRAAPRRSGAVARPRWRGAGS
jgi:hypothetical protein